MHLLAVETDSADSEAAHAMISLARESLFATLASIQQARFTWWPFTGDTALFQCRHTALYGAEFF